MSLESKWNNLRPTTKRNVMLGTAGTVVAGIFIAYAATGTKTPTVKRGSAAAKPEVTLLMGKPTKDVSTEALQARVAMMESQMSQLERKLASVDGNTSPKAPTGAESVLPYEGGSDLVTLPGTPITRTSKGGNAPQQSPAPNIPSQIKPLNPKELTQAQTPTSQLTPMPFATNMQDNKPAVVDLTPVAEPKDGKPFAEAAPMSNTDLAAKATQGSRIRGFASSSQPTTQNNPAPVADDQPSNAPVSKNGLPLTQREKVNQNIRNVSLASKNQETKPSFYIPPGTILSGVAMTGADVPTGPNSKSEPLPLLFRIKDLAILPNYQLLDIRECFVLVSSYGDLSSERAHMRTETLSCVTNENKVIDSKLDAFASGEDGKAGIRGRIVSKAGSVIAKGAMASFIEGISNIFQPSRVRAISINPSSTEQYQMPNTDFALTQGAFAGARSTAMQIKDYYMKTADSIFPIIEVDAGRNLDFIVTRGVTITPKSQGEITPSSQGNNSPTHQGSESKVNAMTPKNIASQAMGAINSQMGSMR